MHSLIIILVCVVIVVSQENLRNACFHGLVLNVCKCDSATSFPSNEVKLDCTGDRALNTATEIVEFADDNIEVIELKITSASLRDLNFNNLNHFPYLKKLFLQKNNISSIDSFTFQEHLVEIIVLDLSHNHLTHFEADTFKYLEKLRNFTLAYNEIETLELNFFHNMPELQTLDLSNNKLRLVDSNWFNKCKKLQSLLLANNNISFIELNAFQNLVLLQVLDLSGNKLSLIPDHLFTPLSSLRTLSLAVNGFKSLKPHTFQGNKMLKSVNLTGNPWICDKNMIPLLDWLKEHEIDRAYCMEPPEFNNSSLLSSLYVLYLEVKLDESPICNASMCNCTVSKDKHVVTVDCVGRGFTKLPESLPYKTKALDLRNNYIQSLNTDHVNVTQWADVAFLHLNNNRIDSLKGLEGSWLLHNLVALHLYKNELTEIPIHILEQFRGGVLDELYLSGNPWNCGCNTVRFQMWLQDHYKSIKDFDLIRCSPDSGVHSNQLIVRLGKSQLCPQQTQLINYLDVLNGLMAVAIILIIMKLSFDYWLQKRTGKLPRFFSINIY